MLSVERDTNKPSHCLQSCTLECFWQSMLSLMAAWPRLPMSGYVVRLFNEMRRRCAFFLSYREYSSADAKRRFEESERQVLGLHASLFALLNFDATAPLDAASRANDNIDLTAGLLDNFNFAAINEDGYVNVNIEFVDQCEMIFHHMQAQIRQAVGLARSPLDSTLSLDVLVTPYVDERLQRDSPAIERARKLCSMCCAETRSALTPAHIDRLDRKSVV